MYTKEKSPLGWIASDFFLVIFSLEFPLRAMLHEEIVNCDDPIRQISLRAEALKHFLRIFFKTFLRESKSCKHLCTTIEMQTSRQLFLPPSRRKGENLHRNFHRISRAGIFIHFASFHPHSYVEGENAAACLPLL